MDYQLPNPEDNPTASLVIYYKVLKGVEYDDRSWDKIHFARCSKAAKELFEICTSFEIAKRCLEDLAKKFDEIGCSWKLETVVSHSHEWKIRRGKNDGKVKQRLFDAIAKSRSDHALEAKGSFITGGEIINGLGVIEFVRDNLGSEVPGRNSENGGTGKRIPPDRVEKKEIGGFEGTESAVGG